MGTPRKQRRRYARPKHPYNIERITEEKEVVIKYGLKNKTELWKAQAELGRIRTQAKKLLVATGEESEKEKKQLVDKLTKIGIDAKEVDDILKLTVSAILDRRLQSVVAKKGLARTVKQARQFIIHQHILVNNKRVTIPSYKVLAAEQDTVRLTDVAEKKFAQEEEPVKE